MRRPQPDSERRSIFRLAGLEPEQPGRERRQPPDVLVGERLSPQQRLADQIESTRARIAFGDARGMSHLVTVAGRHYGQLATPADERN